MKTGTGLDGYDSASAVATRLSIETSCGFAPLCEARCVCFAVTALGACDCFWLLHPFRRLYIAVFHSTFCPPQMIGGQDQNSEPQPPSGLEVHVSCHCCTSCNAESNCRCFAMCLVELELASPANLHGPAACRIPSLEAADGIAQKANTYYNLVVAVLSPATLYDLYCRGLSINLHPVSACACT